MLSNNVNMTQTVFEILFGRSERTLFDYVSSWDPGRTLGITCGKPDGYKRFVLLSTIGAIDPVEAHPETFTAVFAARGESKGNHFVMATLTIDPTIERSWNHPPSYKVKQIRQIETLQPSAVEEQQMWSRLRMLVDLGLKRAADHVAVIADSSKLVSDGTADFLARMASDNE